MSSGRRASRLPALGRRGGGWVAGQVVLMVAAGLSALAGRGWSGGYAVPAHAGGVGLIALGAVLGGLAGHALGSSLTPFPAPRANERVTSSGPYALVRHPIYGAAVLIALGWAVLFASVPGLGLTVVLGVFLDLKARREEIWLDERVPGYQAYRARTPRKLVPFIY